MTCAYLRDTAEQAFRKVLPCARRVLARQMDALLAGTAKETPQDEAQATYFGGRKPEDGRIIWTQTSRQIFNLIAIRDVAFNKNRFAALRLDLFDNLVAGLVTTRRQHGFSSTLGRHFRGRQTNAAGSASDHYDLFV